MLSSLPPIPACYCNRMSCCLGDPIGFYCGEAFLSNKAEYAGYGTYMVPSKLHPRKESTKVNIMNHYTHLPQSFFDNDSRNWVQLFKPISQISIYWNSVCIMGTKKKFFVNSYPIRMSCKSRVVAHENKKFTSLRIIIFFFYLQCALYLVKMWLLQESTNQISQHTYQLAWKQTKLTLSKAGYRWSDFLWKSFDSSIRTD